MAQVNIELPENIYSLLHCGPKELSGAIRLAASAHWYEQGLISQEWGATIAGIDRTDFLLALGKIGKDAFTVDMDELDDELARS